MPTPQPDRATTLRKLRQASPARWLQIKVAFGQGRFRLGRWEWRWRKGKRRRGARFGVIGCKGMAFFRLRMGRTGLP